MARLRAEVAELRNEVKRIKPVPALTVTEIKAIKKRNRELKTKIEEFMLDVMEHGGFDPDLASGTFSEQADALAEEFPDLRDAADYLKKI